MQTIPLTPIRIGSQFKEAFSNRSMTASDAATGLLSQAVQNLQGSILRLVSLAATLPPEARTKEEAAASLLQNEIAKITTIQKAVSQFADEALPRLQQAKTDLDNNVNIDQIAFVISQTSASAATLKQTVAALRTDIAATKGQIFDLSTSLATIENQLISQSISLNTQVESAQQEAESIRSQYKYFAALLIFGVVGLIATAIALRIQEDKVNGLLAQASDMRSQIANLKLVKLSIEEMIVDFSDILTRLSGVGNAVDFLAGDNEQVINDLNNAHGGRGVVKIFIITTISQLQTLQTDAA